MITARKYIPSIFLSRQVAFPTEAKRRLRSLSVSATPRSSTWSGSWGRESVSEDGASSKPPSRVSRGSGRQEAADRQPRDGFRRQTDRNGAGGRDSSLFRARDSGGRRRPGGRFGQRSDSDVPFSERWRVQQEGHQEVKDTRAALRGQVQLYGVAPVLAALVAERRTLHCLFMQESMSMKKKKDVAALQSIREKSTQLGVPVTYLSKHVMNTLAGNRPHQGFLLDCGELPYSSMDVLPSVSELAQAAAAGAPPPVWLVVDEVSDPQNLGAVVRSGMFLGAAGILAASRNCAPLSPAASKASAGCIESFQLHDCDNLPRTLAQAAEDGWSVVGASAESDAVDCCSVKVDRPTLLVLGSEGTGLRTNVKRACESFVKVSSGECVDGSVVDSLNVSVATGVLLHTMLSSARSNAAQWTEAV